MESLHVSMRMHFLGTTSGQSSSVTLSQRSAQLPLRTSLRELRAMATALAQQCPAPQRPRAVLLAYTWGTGPSSCSPYFVRSWIALPPEERAQTDLVILWEGSDPPCGGEPAGGGSRYVKMPPAILAPLKATRLAPAAYRMRAFNWWLSLPEGVGYGYVGALDTDIIFQADLFDRLHPMIDAAHELHLVSENPSERNEGYTTRRLHAQTSCDRPLTRHLRNASVLPSTAAIQRHASSKHLGATASGTAGHSPPPSTWWPATLGPPKDLVDASLLAHQGRAALPGRQLRASHRSIAPSKADPPELAR